jgi:glyoxylase-like metal-dependent hydrolase (beta-lactamase superfamily II)
VQIRAVLGNSQRLDGGAMFGNAPKALWQRWIEPAGDNTIPLATRTLLVQEDGGRNVLLEAGIGTFFPPDLRRRYGVVEDHDVLVAGLAGVGLDPADVDVVVLSHLHFDHAGGLLRPWAEGRAPELAFPSARFLVSSAALDRARSPHLRDRASFIDGLPDLLESTGRLEVVDSDRSRTLGAGYRFHFSQGHTPGLMMTEVESPAGFGGPVLFASDLVPAMAWVHLPVTMGYDRAAELLVDEKARVLTDLASRGAALCFVHDPDVAFATPSCDDAGRWSAAPVQPAQ